jgi:hypothetical protein
MFRSIITCKKLILSIFLSTFLGLFLSCTPTIFVYQPTDTIQKSIVPHSRVIGFRPLIDSNTTSRYHVTYCALVKDPVEAFGREMCKVMSRQDSTSTYVYGDTGQPMVVVKGTVKKLFWSAYPEIWSLIPPLIILWPLHMTGLPVAPSYNYMKMDITFTITDQSGTSKVVPVHIDYDELVMYSVLNVKRQDTKFQTHSLDSAVRICTKRLLKEIL